MELEYVKQCGIDEFRGRDFKSWEIVAFNCDRLKMKTTRTRKLEKSLNFDIVCSMDWGGNRYDAEVERRKTFKGSRVSWHLGLRLGSDQIIWVMGELTLEQFNFDSELNSSELL